MATSKLKHKGRVMAVPLEKMRCRVGVSQREFRPSWANRIAKNFDIEKLGHPIVNRVGEWFWIVDGQHRYEGTKTWLGDWKGQTLDCLVFENLTEKEEADLFLGTNETLRVDAFEKFGIALTAGYEAQVNVDALIQKNGLKRSKNHEGSSVSCVTTLLKIYQLGPDCLDRTLKIVHESLGDVGLERDILEGVGLLVSRFNGRLDGAKAIHALGAVRGGVNAVRSRAERLRQQTGAQKAHCIAATAVEIYNRSKGGKKLPSWWKSDGA